MRRWAGLAAAGVNGGLLLLLAGAGSVSHPRPAPQASAAAHSSAALLWLVLAPPAAGANLPAPLQPALAPLRSPSALPAAAPLGSPPQPPLAQSPAHAVSLPATPTAEPQAVVAKTGAFTPVPTPGAAGHDAPSADASAPSAANATLISASLGSQTSPSAAQAVPVALSSEHRLCSAQQVARYYPSLLKERGVQGLVRLKVRVDEQGRASEVEVQTGSGWRLMDEAARQVAQACAYTPARRGDQAVASWVEYPVRFTLQAGSTE